MYLVPAEKESAADVLRYFAGEVEADGLLAINNVPPGRYWTLAQTWPNKEIQSEMKLRLPGAADQRDRL